MSTALRPIALALILAVLSACAPIIENHGYVPPDDQLALLQVGVSTKEDVTREVGRPTSLGVLDSDGWYYVQSEFRRFGLRAPREVDREVVAISFNDAGTISNVERFGLEQGRVVALSRRVTDDNVQGIGFLRQLFSNLGNFNAADFLD